MISSKDLAETGDKVEVEKELAEVVPGPKC